MNFRKIRFFKILLVWILNILIFLKKKVDEILEKLG